MHKYLLVPALLACAGLIMTAPTQAGHGGGGHGGGGHGGGHGGGGHGGSFHGHGGTVVRIGVGFGGYGYGGYGYGYYPSAYGYPYVYTVPSVQYYPVPVPVDYGATTAPAVPQMPPAAPSTVANIRVIVPDGQAKVWFDGALTKQDGTDRMFHTPSLTAGTTYTYRIRASWMQSGKEQVQEAVANIVPGQTTVVDFTKSAQSEGLPAPK
jgi:uncharacterized protein (TIGR03000 family)